MIFSRRLEDVLDVLNKTTFNKMSKRSLEDAVKTSRIRLRKKRDKMQLKRLEDVLFTSYGYWIMVFKWPPAPLNQTVLSSMFYINRGTLALGIFLL